MTVPAPITTPTPAASEITPGERQHAGRAQRALLLDLEGQRRGEIRRTVDSTQAGALLASCYFSSVLRWIREEPPPFDLPVSLDAALDIVLRGLLTSG
ncbi:hypothetical protein ADK57_03240 [Streptomyces sp. MMG1533]|uniref:hypothetical protein n=1 Tax=Streptomyces sp. MMG1533 TaxID=1415546 RepID=UPI0006AE587B|nr:hypothetical protein [Streptomyces sp. MMG1533]KOU77155.1 hypothetical protein ADK57_03240 [Streptomyces sp. MMG1533]